MALSFNFFVLLVKMVKFRKSIAFICDIYIARKHAATANLFAENVRKSKEALKNANQPRWFSYLYP